MSSRRYPMLMKSCLIHKKGSYMISMGNKEFKMEDLQEEQVGSEIFLTYQEEVEENNRKGPERENQDLSKLKLLYLKSITEL